MFFLIDDLIKVLNEPGLDNRGLVIRGKQVLDFE